MSLSPELKSSVGSLVKGISDASQALMRHDESARATVIDQARALIAELERPNETILWLAWAEPTRRAAISIAMALDIFPLLSAPKSASQIAASCNASKNLIQRLLRHLAATSVIVESKSGTYTSTPLSRSLCDPRHRAALTYSSMLPGPVLARLPAYFALTGYHEPQACGPSPFQHAFSTTLSPWAWARNQPGVAEAFVQHMSGYHVNRPSWMDADFYPVEEHLTRGCKEGDGEVLLVDVGGGLGHDLEQLRHKCSALLSGKRLILQELSQKTVDGARKVRPWIEAMVHDFFTPQPVRGKPSQRGPDMVLGETLAESERYTHVMTGARAYYLHSVLHDWQDEECRQILRHLRSAMEPGYSKILINENIMPEVGAAWQITSLDWTMMATVASAERSEKQWRDLISSSGLQVKGIWTKDPACESLIEVTLTETAKL